jgi:hypothetical protein
MTHSAFIACVSSGILSSALVLDYGFGVLDPDHLPLTFYMVTVGMVFVFAPLGALSNYVGKRDTTFGFRPPTPPPVPPRDVQEWWTRSMAKPGSRPCTPPPGSLPYPPPPSCNDSAPSPRPAAARNGLGQTARRKREAAGYRQKGTRKRLRLNKGRYHGPSGCHAQRR